MEKKFSINENELRLLIKKQNQIIKETLEKNLKHPSEVAKHTRQVAANEYSKTLEKLIDYYKKCCIKEEILKNELAELQSIKEQISNKIVNKI